jgi:hypothetical protein
VFLLFCESPLQEAGRRIFIHAGGGPPVSLSKKSLQAFFAKLLSKLQNQFLQHDFAILPLRRVIERERTP